MVKQRRIQNIHWGGGGGGGGGGGCNNMWPKEGRKDIFYLTTHSTHFIYGNMASDIW